MATKKVSEPTNIGKLSNDSLRTYLVHFIKCHLQPTFRIAIPFFIPSPLCVWPVLAAIFRSIATVVDENGIRNWAQEQTTLIMPKAVIQQQLFTNGHFIPVSILVLYFVPDYE